MAGCGGRHNCYIMFLIFDNERYGETGMQETATALKADLENIALGCGISATKTITTENQLQSILRSLFNDEGPLFYVIKVRAEPLDFVLPPKDGAYLKDRFRQAVLGDLSIVKS